MELAAASEPLVSIIIPALNEARNLPQRPWPACLEVDEVILVDFHASADVSKTILIHARRYIGFDVHLVAHHQITGSTGMHIEHQHHGGRLGAGVNQLVAESYIHVHLTASGAACELRLQGLRQKHRCQRRSTDCAAPRHQSLN